MVSSWVNPTGHALMVIAGTLAPGWQAQDKAGSSLLSINIVKQCCRADSRQERREFASVIDEYPLCKRLMEAYRRVYHMPNKTPLSILFEYASRLNLQVCPSSMIDQICPQSLRSSVATPGQVHVPQPAVSLWQNCITASFWKAG